MRGLTVLGWTMRSLTVLVDVDDVTADLVPAWLHRYNQDYGAKLMPHHLRSWNMQDWVTPDCGEKIYDYLLDPTLYDEVQPVPGAILGIRSLRDMGHRVVFVTSASGPGMNAKLQWLIRHKLLPDHGHVHNDYVCAHDKGLIRGDVLVDDRAATVEAFSGRKILFHRPWNADVVTDHIGASRVTNWDQIVDLMPTGVRWNTT